MMTSRTVRVLVTPELVAQVMTQGHEIPYPVRCTLGLPAGSRLVRVEAYNGIEIVDNMGVEGLRWVALTFAHDSFAPVDVGADPPTITPTYEYQYPPAPDVAALPPTEPRGRAG